MHIRLLETQQRNLNAFSPQGVLQISLSNELGTKYCMKFPKFQGEFQVKFRELSHEGKKGEVQMEVPLRCCMPHYLSPSSKTDYVIWKNGSKIM